MSDEIIKGNVIKGLLHSISNRGNALKKSIENFGINGANSENGANGFHDFDNSDDSDESGDSLESNDTVGSKDINGADVHDIDGITNIDHSNDINGSDVPGFEGSLFSSEVENTADSNDINGSEVHAFDDISNIVHANDINGSDVHDVDGINNSLNTIDFQDSKNSEDSTLSDGLQQLDEIEIAQLHSDHHSFAEYFSSEAVVKWNSDSYIEDNITQNTNAYSAHLADTPGERIYLRIQLQKDNPNNIILVSVPLDICYKVYNVNKPGKPLQEQWLASGSWQESKALFLLLFRALFIAWPSNKIEDTSLSLAKNTEKLNLWEDNFYVTRVKQNFYLNGVNGYVYVEYPTQLLKSWL